MKLTILGSGAGMPSKRRKTQSIILDLVTEINEYFLIDAGEALQHQLLLTNIKPRKINHIFITHLHGDHVYGLPGFLSSRAYQGGAEQDVHLYGPRGLKEWIEHTFKISGSSLNYNVHFHEIYDGMHFKIKGFDVRVKLLNHPLDSYLYVFKEPDKEGALDAEKLKSIGIKPGPIYSEIKASESFSHENIVYNTKDFLGEKVLGRKVAIHGDTRLISDSLYFELIKDSTLVVHEATFLEYESEKAYDYGHSEIHDVLKAFEPLNIKIKVFTHISNRYDEQFIEEIKAKLPSDVYIAEDFFTLEI